MALFIATGHGGCNGGSIISTSTTPTKHHPYIHHPQILFPPKSRRALQIVVSAKKLSRSGRFDSKNKRSSISTKEEEIDENISDSSSNIEVEKEYYEILAKLPKDEPDFWEGSQFDALGFFVQYLWAFGVGFSLIACGIAVATYNEGATDFKETPAYKESEKSRELLEGEDSDSDVFESNPTEVAPALVD